MSKIILILICLVLTTVLVNGQGHGETSWNNSTSVWEYNYCDPTTKSTQINEEFVEGVLTEKYPGDLCGLIKYKETVAAGTKFSLNTTLEFGGNGSAGTEVTAGNAKNTTGISGSVKQTTQLQYEATSNRTVEIEKTLDYFGVGLKTIAVVKGRKSRMWCTKWTWSGIAWNVVIFLVNNPNIVQSPPGGPRHTWMYKYYFEPSASSGNLSTDSRQTGYASTNFSVSGFTKDHAVWNRNITAQSQYGFKMLSTRPGVTSGKMDDFVSNGGKFSVNGNPCQLGTFSIQFQNNTNNDYLGSNIGGAFIWRLIGGSISFSYDRPGKRWKCNGGTVIARTTGVPSKNFVIPPGDLSPISNLERPSGW